MLNAIRRFNLLGAILDAFILACGAALFASLGIELWHAVLVAVVLFLVLSANENRQ